MSSNETRKKILEVKNLDVVFGSGKKTFKAVSYTHLTLPTIRLV